MGAYVRAPDFREEEMVSDMMHDMMSGGGFWWLWMLVPLLFLGGLVALIVWALMGIFPARRAGNELSNSSTDSTEETLRVRFARGEMSAEEYEKALEIPNRETPRKGAYDDFGRDARESPDREEIITMENKTKNSAEKTLRERFARGEIDAEEYERSLKVLQSERAAAKGSGAKPKLLVAGLATVALLTLGVAGATFAHGQADSATGGAGQTNSMADGADMGSMMSGDGMGSMMDGDGMGSMMGDGQMQMMGTFDEDKPFDLQFIDQMIMHHSGAIMSSEMMIADSKRPELRELAANIEESQTEQIKQMKDMRERWYSDAERTFGMMDPTRMDEMMGDGMMEGMMGGSMRDMMGADATDEMFLEMMIPHHQMAVDMSEKAIDGAAEHPELEELARTIKEEQSAEIELMRGYLEETEQTSSQ